MNEKIEFVCKDCGGEVVRDPDNMVIGGLTPSRCFMCTFDRMREDGR